ncbi:MAG: two-component regulator propeller domain-containing protein, partial [Pseudomonadota bacterium]
MRRRWLNLLLLGGAVLANICGAVEAGGRPLDARLVPDLETYPQHFGLARSADGMLYLATIGGVALFDGARWTLVTLPAAQPARVVTPTDTGVLVGAYDDFGIVVEEPTSRHAFTSLLAGFPDAGEAPIGPVRQAIVHDGWWHFRTDQALFSTRPDGTERRLLRAQQRLGPLQRLGDELLLLKDGELGRYDPGGEFSATGALPDGFSADDAVQVGDRLLLMDATGQLMQYAGGRFEAAPIAPGVGRYLSMLALGPDTVAFGTTDGEIEIHAFADGLIERVPLTDDRIDALVHDPFGGLWALSHTELIHLDWPPKWRAWTGDDGLRGTINRAFEHDGSIWLASSAGVFRSTDGRRFDKLPWTASEAWDLLPLDGGFLLAETAGLVWISDAGTRERVPGIADPRLLRRAADGGVWVGTNTSVVRLENQADGIPGIVEEWNDSGLVRSLVEAPDGQLWIGTLDRFVVRIDRATGQRQRFGPEEGLGSPADPAAAVALVDGAPWLASKGDLLRWDATRGLEPVAEADRPPVAVIDFTFRTL